MSDLEILLDLISASGHARGFIEVRALHRPSHRWTRFFVGVRARRSLSRVVPAMAALRDVYIAPAPRVWRGGTREAVAQGFVVWADCDTPLAARALAAFPIAPHLVVTSGTPGHLHAYWRLGAGVERSWLEHANRRLAVALGADPAVANANAIMRPPGTLNHKHEPPAATRIAAARSGRVRLQELLSHCPPAAPAPSTRAIGVRASDDELTRIPPEIYVRVLLGTEVPRSRKVCCPGPHEDRSPSLHVYDSPERGWHCFGCGAGGSIYDLAALVWDMNTRGRDFIELRRRLLAQLGRSAHV